MLPPVAYEQIFYAFELMSGFSAAAAAVFLLSVAAAQALAWEVKMREVIWVLEEVVEFDPWLSMMQAL